MVMTKHLMKKNFIILCLFSGLLIPPTLFATSVLPITLERLSTRAALIFYGTVISNQVQKDSQSGQIVTLTEFEVIDLIKGDTATRHTIKQLGGYLKDADIKFQIHGVPEYQIGNQYVIFLPKKSSLGFSSPIGLHQGSFSVQTIDGEKIISNGRKITSQQTSSNQTVQVPLATFVNNPSRARLADFINTVRAHNTK